MRNTYVREIYNKESDDALEKLMFKLSQGRILDISIQNQNEFQEKSKTIISSINSNKRDRIKKGKRVDMTFYIDF